MKRVLFFCCVIGFLGVLLVACHETDAPTQQTMTTTDSQMIVLPAPDAIPSEKDAEWYPLYQQYQKELEPDRSPLPSFEDLKKITISMPFTEAYEIAGTAQRKDSKVLVDVGHPQMSARPVVTYFIYDTQEGIEVKIHFLTAYNVDENEYQNDVMGVTYVYPDGREETLTRTNTQ